MSCVLPTLKARDKHVVVIEISRRETPVDLIDLYI